MNKGYLYLMLCCLSQGGLIFLGWYIRRRIETRGLAGLLPDFKRYTENVTRILQTNQYLRNKRP
jgi:hypothetical protein